jgi:MFS family permease
VSRVYLRIGFRPAALIGSGIVLAGTVLIALVNHGIGWIAVACFVVGAGMGMVAAPTLIAAQSTVEWDERGVVTGTNMFSRSIGSAVGVAVFGAIANASLGPNGATSAPALDRASQHVFMAVVLVAGVMCVAVAFLPRISVRPQPSPG